MHNTYMSKEDFKQLKAGDQVTIRQIDDLCHDFGSEINVPCGWADDMDNICGSTLPIDYVENEQDGSTAVVYVHDDNDNEWALTAEVFEPRSFKGISQAEMTEMWEKMILGENANNEK